MFISMLNPVSVLDSAVQLGIEKNMMRDSKDVKMSEAATCPAKALGFTFWDKHKVSIIGSLAALGIAAAIFAIALPHIHDKITLGLECVAVALVGELVAYGVNVNLLAKKIHTKLIERLRLIEETENDVNKRL